MNDGIAAPTSAHDAPPVTASSRGYRVAYPFARLLIRMILRGLAPRLRVTGKNHIPRGGPLLFAPNHLSDCDPPFVFNAVRRPLWFMAKEELFGMAHLKGPIRFAQAFPVDPNGLDREALRRGEALLRAGHGLVVFPEGRISQSGAMGPVLPGVCLLALHTG